MISILDDHGFEDTTSTRKVEMINDTIFDICSREPWPFLEKELTLTFTGSAYPSNWPTDFSKLVGLSDPVNSAPLYHERWEIVRRRFADTLTETGTPQYFYFVKNQLRCWPVPTNGTTLALDYLCWPSEVTDATTESSILIPARHHRAIVLGTLYKLYAMEDDPEQSAIFREEYEARIARMREDLMRVQYASPDRIIVTADEFYDPYYD